ncbi:MAG: DUF547 domain-containing protein [Bacteroidota bacterium]
MKKSILWVIALSIAFPTLAAPPSHAPFTKLLKQYVTADGWVKYKVWKNHPKDLDKLQAYCDTLSNDPPQDSWTKNERLAYWINAYNAFTLKLILDNYPLNSIQDLHPTIKIPMVSTVWHKKFFKIGGEDFNLDEIEHGILRKDFEEPRIHFAINCASYSCPQLRSEAFTADKLEAQLTDQAKRFINGELRNKVSQDKAELSKIFRWFKGDFTKQGSLRAFINQYADQQMTEETKISYLEYDWSLNEPSK